MKPWPAISDEKKSLPVVSIFSHRRLPAICFGVLLLREQVSPVFCMWVLRGSPACDVNQSLFAGGEPCLVLRSLAGCEFPPMFEGGES